MSEDDVRVLARLSAKQRQVLDLLIEHKSSKEIARELGISPHTVDQRVQFAREKLGAATRSECAVEYRRLVQLCRGATQAVTRLSHPSPYDESRSAQDLILVNLAAERNGEALIALERQYKAGRTIAPATV